jgi:hypothetical protein
VQLAIDVTGGASYVELGTTQLLSVPYALHAKTADVALTGGGSSLPLNAVFFKGELLYVSPQDNSEGIQWYNGTNTTTGATSTTDGEANTTAIVADQGVGPYAAYICDTLTAFGYTDWYLPSKDELNAVYLQQYNIEGGFTTTSYWSSTEYNYSSAWYQNFGSGDQKGSDYKGSSGRVRCVRR